MNVAQYQLAFARICTAVVPAEDDLRALGGSRERWLLYRDMVRGRLQRTSAEAMPKTAAALGSSYPTVFARYLAERAPQSRFLRDVVLEFDDFLQTSIDLPLDAAERIRDTSRYERARWEVRDLDVQVPPSAADWDFELAPLVNPVRRVVSVRHPVWSPKRMTTGEVFEAPVSVALVRKRDDTIARVVLRGPYDAVVGAWAGLGESATSSVERLAAGGVFVLDPEFVADLCDQLAGWIATELVLGSRPA